MQTTLSQYLNEFQYLQRSISNGNISPNEIEETYNFYLSQKITVEQLTDSDRRSLVQMFKALKVIDDILLPFRNSRVPYELSIAGGSVYDILTGNSDITKDFDIILHFPISKGNYSEIGNPNNYTYDTDVTDSEVHDIKEEFQESVRKLFKKYLPDDNPFERSPVENKLYHTKADHVYKLNELSLLVNELVRRKLVVTNIFSPEEFPKETAYRNRFIYSLIKIEDSTIAKPVDLIVSQFNPNYFCYTFDFNLCRTYINYRKGLFNPEDLATTGFSHKKMLQHLFFSPDTAKDLKNKTITMDLSDSDEKVEYFMERHYPRLKEKLPDYDLEFIIDNSNSQHLEWSKRYKSIDLHHKLQRTVAPKETQAKKLKL